MTVALRVSSILPIQKYLQDTMRADTGAGGVKTLLGADGDVYVMRTKSEPGAALGPLPVILLSTPTELGSRYAHMRVANDGSQQVDIWTPETTTDELALTLYGRILFLFDEKKPIIAGFKAIQALRVEFLGCFPDQGGGSTHASLVIRSFLQVLQP